MLPASANVIFAFPRLRLSPREWGEKGAHRAQRGGKVRGRNGQAMRSKAETVCSYPSPSRAARGPLPLPALAGRGVKAVRP